MARVSAEEKDGFFQEVEAAANKAIWCAVATLDGDRPRVRVVHPTWEGSTLWFATGISSPKIAQLRANPNIDVQFQVAPPDFIHILVHGKAEIVEDPGEKKRVWDVFNYDLSDFWPGGPDDPDYMPVRVVPERVELSKMFGTQDKRVWRS